MSPGSAYGKEGPPNSFTRSLINRFFSLLDGSQGEPFDRSAGDMSFDIDGRAHVADHLRRFEALLVRTGARSFNVFPCLGDTERVRDRKGRQTSRQSATKLPAGALDNAGAHDWTGLTLICTSERHDPSFFEVSMTDMQCQVMIRSFANALAYAVGRSFFRGRWRMCA